MVGGGRRGAEEVKLNTGNVFAALETLKKKKKGGGGDKAKGGSSSRRKQDEAAQQPPPQNEVFWAPVPLTTESWADVEDDDDYFATTAPPSPVWGPGHGDDEGKEEDDEEDAVHAASPTSVAVVSSLWSSRQNPRIIGSVSIREFENLLNTLTKLLKDKTTEGSSGNSYLPWSLLHCASLLGPLVCTKGTALACSSF